MPLASQFRKFPLGKNLEIVPMCHDIGSACYLWQISRREFACCTSLGECSTTHKDIIVHFWTAFMRSGFVELLA